MQTRQRQASEGRPRDDENRLRLPATRIGLASGLVAILCCVGPAALALVGLIGGATAYTLATDLYTEWGWWFRAAGLLVAAGLVWIALRRRDACHVDGVRRSGRSLMVILVVAGVTYGAMYALTTWLGTFV
ncbi:MAG: hypothetical protein KY469_22155 [Actinobacteria bacterium]|nr:hypothetical protein [Actinomycetota bacterium]